MSDKFTPAKPRYSLAIGKEIYELEGTFGLIEAAEYALKDGIVSIAMRCADMPVHEMSRLLLAILKQSGHDVKQDDLNEVLWNEIGITSNEYAMLCLHVHAFLRICISKPADREAVKNKMGELLGEGNQAAPSPGPTTSKSA